MTKTEAKKRITLFISSLSNGGAERVTCNLANFLFTHGYEVDVITLSNKNDTYKLNKGVRRVNLLDEGEQRGKLYNIITERKRLKRYIKANKDIICYITMLPINSFMLTRLRRKIRGKIIVSDRVNPASYSRIYSSMMRYAAKKSDGFVVQTREIREWYKNIKNVAIIPNAINKDIDLSRSKIIDKKFVAVGRLSRQKNYPMLIRAFSMFNREHPDYRLEIYGDGADKESLESIVVEEDLVKKVIFKGYVRDVSKHISNATGFLMASNYEGMSNALIEAMCIGIPCVATDCDGGGAREIITNMDNGILVKKNDVVGMFKGMMTIVEDKNMNTKISNNAVKLKDRLMPERIYGEWQRYIMDVIEIK